MGGRSQNQNSPNTRFLTGNQAIDSAAWGAALGAGTQYFANQVFNPCRNRGGTRNSNNKGTNNRSSATQTLTTGSLDSSEVSLQPQWLRMLDSPPTVGEPQQEGGELHSL